MSKNKRNIVLPTEHVVRETDEITSSHTAFTGTQSNSHTGRSDVQIQWCISVTSDESF